MDSMAHILGSFFAGMLAGLIAMNVTVIVLRLRRKDATADRILRLLRPAVSYLRLGGKSRSDSSGRAAHHA